MLHPARQTIASHPTARPARPSCAIAVALAVAALGVGLLSACTTSASRGEASPDDPAGPAAVLRRADIAWLDRVTFGVDDGTLSEYRWLGRAGYLERQLHPDRPPLDGAPAADVRSAGSHRAGALPAPVAAEIDALAISHLDATRTLAELRARRRLIRLLPAGADRAQARRALDLEGNRLADEAIERELLRAIYSPDQLRELMVWFWLNHFSVHEYKGDLRWLVADYEEQAIRPHALGHFRDLVLATLEHPAMLEYLDNRQNAARHLNENYARELMELHTLGVGGGYTQQDVEQLARVLTGVGIDAGFGPRLRPALRARYVHRGAFEFDPVRHDFGPKVLLGHRLSARGFAQVEEAVTLIVRQPACARFISRELATYFVSDDPPPRLVEAMARRFEQTDGDIAAVLQTLFTSDALDASLGSKFKDPIRYEISAVRLTLDGRIITDARPLVSWLRALGEAPYGHPTPDGYPLTASGWDSPGQMSRRFEIARVIAGGNARLLGTESSSPQRRSRLYREAVEPFLAAGTRAALEQADSPREWNTFLLASPEMNYE